MNTVSISSHGLIVHKRGLDLNYLINALIYIALLSSIYGYALLTRADDIYYLIASTFLFGIVLFLHLLNNKSLAKNGFFLIMLLILSIFCSYALNGFQEGKLAIFIVFFGYIFLFCILPEYKLHILFDRTIVLFLLGYSFLPIIIFILFNQQSMVSAYSGTFSGFADHRNGYGYIAGATILVLINKKSRLAYLLIPFIAYGLILSQSRSSIIATIIAALYLLIYRQKRIKKYYFYPISALLLVIFYLVFSHFIERNIETSDIERKYLFDGFVEFIKAHPIWGNGGAYQIDYYNRYINEATFQPAHNTILQIWANFGLLVLVLFFILFLSNMKKYNASGRTFFLYILILGMFQPTLSIGINPLICIIFIIAVHGNQSAAASLDKKQALRKTE